MFKRLKRNKKGFTLVELIVVIAILAILAAVLVPTMLTVVGDAEKNTASAQISSIYNAYKYLIIVDGSKTADVDANGKLLETTTDTDSKISKKEIIDYFEQGLKASDFDITFVDGKITKITYGNYIKDLSSGEITNK